jgi:cytochrome b
LEELHEMVSYAMLTVVGMHLVGVLVSSLMHRENLVRAMITGFKSAQPREGIRRAHTWLGVIMLVAVMAFWLGYPATGLVQPSSNVSQAEHQHDDD